MLAQLPLFEIAIVLLRLDYVGSVPVLPYPVTHSSPAYVLYGRASDVAGFVEGLHDQHGSPAGLLIDEAKSIRDEILDTLERCHTTFRLFMSSTGQAAGGFYLIMAAQAHLWKTLLLFKPPPFS